MSDYAMPERQWEQLAPEPHPAPIVTNRPANEGELPASARRLRDAAFSAGWTVQATYSRGTRPGRVLRVVDVVTLRLGHRGTKIWASWVDGKFDVGQIMQPDQLPRLNTLRDIKKEITRERESNE